jgi:hypothetical protein
LSPLRSTYLYLFVSGGSLPAPWLPYVPVGLPLADVGDLRYDLAAAPSRNDAPAVRNTGVDHADSLVVPRLDEAGGVGPVALVGGVAAALVVLGGAVSARLTRARRHAAAGR